MTMYWLYDLPNGLFGLLSILFFNAIGIVGLSTTRRWVKRQHKIDHSHNDIVSYFLAAVTVFYGITLGLLAVSAWTNYSNVEDKVDTEAQVLASLYRDISAYPDPIRTQLQEDLRLGTRHVIDVSWGQQRQGIVPNNSSSYTSSFQDHLTAFQPTTPSQQIIHAEAFRQFNALVEARRARSNSVSTHMPRSLWTLVLLGAIITIGVTLFFDTPSFSLHLWLTVALATLLGLMIFLIGTLDNPFRGRGSVSPAPIERVYDQLMRSPNAPH